MVSQLAEDKFHYRILQKTEVIEGVGGGISINS